MPLEFSSISSSNSQAYSSNSLIGVRNFLSNLSKSSLDAASAKTDCITLISLIMSCVIALISLLLPAMSFLKLSNTSLSKQRICSQ